jgi:raffinose/stachyose/melibiose transport system permease protein
MTETAAAPGSIAAAERAPRPGLRVASRRSLRRRRTLSLVAFALPALVVYGVFLLLPTAAALLMSFTDWNGVDYAYSYVGFTNYRRIAADPLFRESVGTNVQFTLIVLIAQTGLSLALALLLVRNTRATIFWRALYFTPTVIASVSVAIAWILVYDPTVGVLNVTLGALGLESLSRSWLGDRDIAINSLAVVQFWHHTGQVLIIFVAGLQAIPREMHEAAAVEGATTWQRFRFVTWPLLAPSTTIVVAYTTVQSFRAFDLVLALTDGGPANATEIISTWIYHSAFRNYEFGYASAGAVFFLLVLGGLTWLQFRVLRVET